MTKPNKFKILLIVIMIIISNNFILGQNTRHSDLDHTVKGKTSNLAAVKILPLFDSLNINDSIVVEKIFSQSYGIFDTSNNTILFNSFKLHLKFLKIDDTSLIIKGFLFLNEEEYEIYKIRFSKNEEIYEVQTEFYCFNFSMDTTKSENEVENYDNMLLLSSLNCNEELREKYQQIFFKKFPKYGLNNYYHHLVKLFNRLWENYRGAINQR